MYPDKSKLSIADNQRLLIVNEADLIFTTGKFENLQTTHLQTKQIIDNEELYGVKANDVATVLKMKHTFDFMINNTQKLSFNDIKQINLLIQGAETPSAGQLRQRDIVVPLTNDVWTPPKPNEATEKQWFQQLIKQQSISATEKAINLMLHLSHQQYFENGNKRTALFAANNLLLTHGAGMLAIPENKMHWYQSKLQKFNRTNNNRDIKPWLYDNCIFSDTPAKMVYSKVESKQDDGPKQPL